MAKKQRIIDPVKINAAKKITDFFSFISNSEEGGFYFLKLKTEHRTKTFQSMQDGLNQLIDWKKLKIINENEKLDLITLLMKSHLPLICSSEEDTREKILENWRTVAGDFDSNLRINKNFLKSQKLTSKLIVS